MVLNGPRSFVNEAAPKGNPSASILTGLYKPTSEAMQLAIRRGMVRRIEIMLSQRGEHDESSIGKFAEAIERYLYKSASSFQVYTDMKTLNTRVRMVVITLLRRRSKKRELLSRGETIEKVLGVKRLTEVTDMVHQIKMLRWTRMARDCLACQVNGTCSLSSTMPATFKAQEELPHSVRSLFFDTAIVHVFENASIERIPQIDWDALMEQAHRNIKIYDEWDIKNSGKA